ncbi:MAG: hypothetical protein MRY83_09380 [Flavobacteriales bacterium]|nr:hypothetical protein [Flavobacteriales bacterium]
MTTRLIIIIAALICPNIFSLAQSSIDTYILEGVYIPDTPSIKINYQELDLKNSIWTKRVVRKIDMGFQSNSNLKSKGNHKSLFEVIIYAITKENTLTPYNYEPDLKFTRDREMTIIEFIKKFENPKKTFWFDSVSISHYILVEDYFFNKMTGITELRITGLCPVIKPKTEESFYKTFWVYFPELQYPIKKYKLDDESSYYDIMSQRLFSSEVIKEYDTHNLDFNDYVWGY